MAPEAEIQPHDICFGLNRERDEQSLAAFLELFSKKRLTSTLIPRLNGDEIEQIVNLLTGVMRNHLQEKEYHELFLGDIDESVDF